MDEYKPNSHRSKETPSEKKVEKVISGTAKPKKKNGVHKLADVFVAEDMYSVGNYIFMDVLVPAFKKAVSDVVTNGIEMLLYGETGKTKRSSTRVSYSDYYDRNERRSAPSNKRMYGFDEVILDSRSDAEDVLTSMDELIEAYGVASVADLYDLVGMDSNYTDNRYGWTNLRSAQVVRVRDGYLLKLPKALPLN